MPVRVESSYAWMGLDKLSRAKPRAYLFHYACESEGAFSGKMPKARKM